MKSLIIVLAFTFIQIGGMAQSNKIETAKFKVLGNCGMCEKRIENALTVEGVGSAEWNKTTDMVKVTYDSKKINEDKLHALVAAAGHDTEKVRGNDKAYNNLHGCCKYERDEVSSEKEMKDHNQHTY